MAYLTMKQLLESGVHFGHQTKRWNPKMKTYIYGARNGIYIIDLQQTVKLFKVAYDFIRDTCARGGRVLFVGTKKQGTNSIQDEANRCGMEYINGRWVGGFLTNFQTVRKSIDRLNELENLAENPDIVISTKKEALMLDRERQRLDKYLGGVRNLKKHPDALFVIDSRREAISIQEANKLGIPVVALVDSNCDPDVVDYVIPGNDDAIRAIKLFCSAMADACIEGTTAYEEKLQADADKETEAAAAASEGKEFIKAFSSDAPPAEAAPAEPAPVAEEPAPSKEKTAEAAPVKAAPVEAAPAEEKAAEAAPAGEKAAGEKAAE
jgi:small subunit ribosomal protein S2